MWRLVWFTLSIVVNGHVSRYGSNVSGLVCDVSNGGMVTKYHRANSDDPPSIPVYTVTQRRSG